MSKNLHVGTYFDADADITNDIVSIRRKFGRFDIVSIQFRQRMSQYVYTISLKGKTTRCDLSERLFTAHPPELCCQQNLGLNFNINNYALICQRSVPKI